MDTWLKSALKECSLNQFMQGSRHHSSDFNNTDWTFDGKLCSIQHKNFQLFNDILKKKFWQLPELTVNTCLYQLCLMHIKLYIGHTSLLHDSKLFLLSKNEACALQSLKRIGNTIAKVSSIHHHNYTSLGSSFGKKHPKRQLLNPSIQHPSGHQYTSRTFKACKKKGLKYTFAL